MMLYLLKDDSEMTSSSALANAANAIRLHHALAMAADDYVKKQCVFRLFTSDGAMYLIQARLVLLHLTHSMQGAKYPDHSILWLTMTFYSNYLFHMM